MSKPDLTKWVSGDESAKISDPGASKKLAGFLYLEKVAMQQLNWLFNRVSKWLQGLQGGYFDIIVGSAAQVTALEATHVIADLDDTLITAGSKVIFLSSTHTLTANINLSNADISLISESPESIIDLATFTLTISGARTNSKLRVINAGAGDIVVSGANSKFKGSGVLLSAFNASNGANIETDGDEGLSINDIISAAVSGSDTYTVTLGISAYKTGKTYNLTFANTNTIAVPTINFDSLGAKIIKNPDGSALAIGAIPDEASCRYDGVDMILLNPVVNYEDLPINSGTAIATTSGTSHDFTGIPSWVKKITIMFSGVSSNGTSDYLIQLGDSGGVEVIGYLGSGSSVATTVGTINYTTGFGFNYGGGAAAIIHGSLTLSLEDASTNTWVAQSNIGQSNSAASSIIAGEKSLSAVLDRIRLTTVNGTDAFDAGSINILYE